MVEMLPYNWQWAGICELYRNIRCTATEPTPVTQLPAKMPPWWQHLDAAFSHEHLPVA